MLIRNYTTYDIEHLFQESVAGYDHEKLVVEIKYCPARSRRSISGTYYRWTKSAPEGKFIRLRINRMNCYPVTVPFKTSSYYKKTDSRGREVTYQRLRYEKFSSPKQRYFCTSFPIISTTSKAETAVTNRPRPINSPLKG